MTSQQLGQFYTTNYNYILSDIRCIDITNKNIIEPFAGSGDLLSFINLEKKDFFHIECYDIEPKKDFITKRDTLLNPPRYENKFIITNPPYLARNKSNDKIIFNKYNQNDLYKCFIQNLIENNCLGGILIIPLNFWCSIREMDINLRKNFLNIYNIVFINIFEEKVFDDTTYAICSFQFAKKEDNIKKDENQIKCMVFPSKNIINFVLNSDNNYTIGGEIYNLDFWGEIRVRSL